MLPEHLLNFLSQPRMAGVGVRDADNVPRGIRVYGMRVEDDGLTLRVFITREWMNGLREAVEDNGEVALTVSDPVTAETYQFKGKATSLVASDEIDRQTHQGYGQAMGALMLAKFGQLPPGLSRLVGPLDSTLCFVVRDVFVQTPGPEAGARIFGGDG